jgi:hypothetical protein
MKMFAEAVRVSFLSSVLLVMLMLSVVLASWSVLLNLCFLSQDPKFGASDFALSMLHMIILEPEKTSKEIGEKIMYQTLRSGPSSGY